MVDIETFKNEMRNYNSYIRIIKSLDSEIDDIWYQLSGVKGVRYDKIPSGYNKEYIEEKKLDMLDLLEKKIKERMRLQKNIEYLDNILNQLDDWIKEAVIKIYADKEGYRTVASRYMMSPSSLAYAIDTNINKIIKNDIY